MREYFWPIGATMLALGLSLAGPLNLIAIAPLGADLVDQYALWIIAALSWWLPFFLWSMVVTKKRQFRDRVPVLVVNDQGISVRDWRGKSLTFSWTEVIVERVKRGLNDDMLFRAGKISGSVSLNDLDRGADEITEIMTRCSSRTP